MPDVKEADVTLARIPSSAPVIAPIPDSPERPLWSVMIPVYNCAEFIPDALQSVLAQDLGPDLMQIQVVDDASTDVDVAALVEQLGHGRVGYFRQPQNVGSLRNFETCINNARGQLVHLLHGDDRTVPGFYEKIGAQFQRYPTIGAAFSHYAFIDSAGKRTHQIAFEAEKEGILDNWLLRIAQYQRAQYVSMVVRRSVYEKLGSFYGTHYGEDWEMWVRIARYYPVAYIPEVLAEYRGRPGSISWQKANAGSILTDLLHVMNRIQQHLPDEYKKPVLKNSKKYYALFNIGNSYHTLKQTNNWSFAYKQMKHSLRMSNHPVVYYHILKFYIKYITRSMRK